MERKEYEYIQKVKKYIDDNKMLDYSEKVVIGLSGGADSVCLLKMFMCLKEKMNIDIYAVHVHHGIRDISADNDELFCRKICKDNNISIEVVRKDIPKLAKESGESLEECARRVRYEILRDAAVRLGNAKIAVAHHMNDQAETLLFRVIRGTGVKGLSAMRPINDNIIRPLLCLSRDDILAYLKLSGQEFCTDETNADDTYSRNSIRLNIVPEMEKICPGAVSHMASLSEEAHMMSSFVEKCATKLMQEAKISEFKFRCDVLVNEDKIVVLQTIRFIVEDIIHSLKDVTREHIESVYKILSSKEYTIVNLPKGLTVQSEGGVLSFLLGQEIVSELQEDVGSFCAEFKPSESVILTDGRIITAEYDDIDTNAEIPQNLYTKWLDYDKINAGLQVRYRNEGDYIFIDEKGTKKSLSRYMIDEKIPKTQRDQIPLVASGSEIMWVIGYRISARCKVGKNTKTIIKLEVKGEGHEREC